MLALWASVKAYLFWIKLGAVALLIAAVLTFAWSMVSTYTRVIQENVTLKAEIKKYDGRLASYKRMYERRQAAIDASQCKSQINRWVRNPDDIPKKFDPFKNSPLSTEIPDTTHQPNAIDSEPLPPFEWPELRPWKWF